MDASLLANLGAYSAQVVCVAALATLLAYLLRSGGADVRYTYWRVVFAACLLLPLLQVWRDPADLAASRAGGGEVEVSSEVAFAAAPVAVSAQRWIDWGAVALAIIGIGILARLLWLAASVISLQRMRALGIVAPPNDLIQDLQRRLGTRAEIRYVDGLRQPVTFGARRPVVLLPVPLASHPTRIQEAVICHELLHVLRRDWLWVVAEEAVRAVLWFNPAVWWLIARVQLAREELVDELTVLATNRRKAYMEALLTFADDVPLAPAAAFARRRHLFRRMVLLSREGVMSSKRLAAACVVVAAVLLTGSWYAVAAFPLTFEFQATQLLTEPGPLERRAKPVTPENPVPRRTSHAAADYPAAAEAAGLTGAVTFKLTLDEGGTVAEVRLQTIAFRTSQGADGSGASFQATRPADIEAYLKGYEARNPAAAGLRPALDAMITAAFDAVRQWRYDAPYEGPISVLASVPVGPQRTANVRPAPAASWIANADGAVRVGGNIKPPTKIHDVRPVYPDIALAARVSGVVILETLIGPDGSVHDARVLRSIPLLDQAALDAVMQWRFTPTLLNGQPVPVIMTVTVNFTVE